MLERFTSCLIDYLNDVIFLMLALLSMIGHMLIGRSGGGWTTIIILEHTFTDHGVGDGEGFTVYELKGILDGAWNYECECGQEVYSNMGVYGRKMDDDGTSVYYDILADRFEINWKRNRVDVFIDYSADLAD